ncbi:MAG: cytochrome c [Halieaceae bacterium]|nr:cytochrome c [Halieaceae bacterium]
MLVENPDGSESRLATSEMVARYGARELIIDDPHYHERRGYHGVDLRALLEDQGFSVGEQLILECIDGYEIPFDTTVLENPDLDALVAIGDLAPSPGRDFKLFQHGRETVDFDPFYLIWKSADANLDEAVWNKLPWPYQFSRIRRAEDFAPLPPPPEAQASVHSGYATFVDHCVKCHRLGNRGGQLGPPLDRDPGMLRALSDDQAVALVSQVSNFFPGSKMPDYRGKLSETEIREVIGFLRWQLAQPAPTHMAPEQHAADNSQSH